MKKAPAVLALLVLLLLAAWLIGPRLIVLPINTPQEMGLLWQECPLTQDYFGTWQQAEECFGQALPKWGEAEKAKSAQQIDMQNFRLAIGPDIFQTNLLADFLGYELFGLYQNGWPAAFLVGKFYAHTPNIGLQNIGGKPAWEFADDTQRAVVYAGQDLRRLYNLDKTSSPSELNNNLIFIAQKGSRHFVVYNGTRLSPDYDEVLVGYCCEAVLYSPTGTQDRYYFNATRNGQRYLVEISAAKP